MKWLFYHNKIAWGSMIFLLLTSNVFAYSLQGRFVNLDSVGISGITVTASGRSASTDATGTFKIDGLSEGTYEVVATKSGYKDKKLSNVFVGENAGQTAILPTKYLISTVNSYRVQVGVMNAATNTILEGAVVKVGDLTATKVGNYYVANTSSTSGQISVSKSGYSSLVWNFGVHDDAPITTIAWLYLVEGGYKIKGRILNVDQQPIAGVQISTNLGKNAVSQADGTFIISGIENPTSNITLTGKLSGYKDLVRGGYYVDNSVREYPAGDFYMMKAVDGYRVLGCVSYNGNALPNVQVTVGDKVVKTASTGCYNVGLTNAGTYNYEIKVIDEVPVNYLDQVIKLPAGSFIPKQGTVTLTDQAPTAKPDSAYIPAIRTSIQAESEEGTRQKRSGLGVSEERFTSGNQITHLLKIENVADCPFVGNLRLESSQLLPSCLSFVAGQEVKSGIMFPTQNSTHPLDKNGTIGNAPGDYLLGIKTPLNCNLMDDKGGNSPYLRGAFSFPSVPSASKALVNAQVGGILKCETLGILGPKSLPQGYEEIAKILPSYTTVQVVIENNCTGGGSGSGSGGGLTFKAEGICWPSGEKVTGETNSRDGLRSSSCQNILSPPVEEKLPPILPNLNVSLVKHSSQVRLKEGELNYVIEVHNDAKEKSVAQAVTLDISNFPVGLSTAVTTDKGTCSKTNTGIQCRLNDLVNGAGATVTLKVTPQQAPLNGSLTVQLTSQETRDIPQTIALGYTVLPELTECEKNPTCSCVPKPAFCAGIPDLSIVFDDTGSMSEEIGGLRKATTDFITAIASQPTKPSIQLISFKDNYTHRVTTDQMSTLQAHVNSLWASAGADCPENSSGAIDWVASNTGSNRLKDGGRILLVTDASPPHGVDLDSLIKKLVNRGIKVDVLVSGDACVADGKSLSTIDAYSKIAAETQGYFAKVFEINDGTPEGKKKYEDTARQVLFGALFPTILGLDPNKAPQESSLNINLTAANTNFSDNSQVIIQKGDKTLPVNSVKVVSATQLVAKITLSDTVELGAYDVKVETKLGNFVETATAKGMLEVTGPSLTPDIISVTPTSVMQNYTTEVELSGAGTHFVAGVSKLSFGDEGIVVKSTRVDNKTTLRATVEITTTAKLGMHSITVTTGDEVAKTPQDLFLVMQESIFAKLKDVSPYRGTQGGLLQIAITGSNTQFLEGSSALKFSGRGITPLSTQVLDENHLLATLLLEETAPLGFRDVFVSTGDETAVLLNGLEVKARGCHVIAGHIFSQDGQAVPGVYVSLEGQGTFTDATGYYRLDGLLEGEYTVDAQAKGYGFAPQTQYIGGQATCDGGMGEMATLNFQAASQLAVKIVAKDNIGQCIKQDGQITYDLITSNLGTQTATGVVLSNLLPEGVSVANLVGTSCDVTTGTCQLPDLTPNGQAKVTVTLNNNQDRPLVNRVQVTSNEYPPATISRWKCVAPHLSVSIKDTPDPVAMQGRLSYLLEVDLSAYAPTKATGIQLSTRLPEGVELKNLSTKYGTCDTSHLPSITCNLPDLSIEQASDLSHVSVTLDTELKDAGLLLLTLEAMISAQEYPLHKIRERTTIFVPPDVKVDVIFVQDTTESMRPELNGVIKALEKFINELDTQKSPTMALVEFKDEVTVKAFTQDPQLMLKVIRDLEVGGGGSCPEASAEALEIAIRHLKDGGIIILSTDASPYDDADMEGLIELIEGKNMIFHPLITGDCETAGNADQ